MSTRNTVLSTFETTASRKTPNPSFQRCATEEGQTGTFYLIWDGNWRLTFKFKGGHAYVLDYEDYH